MIVNIAQETLSVVVRQRPETQLTFFALLARCGNGRARLNCCDHIKGVSPKARSGAIRALQVAGLVQIAAKGRGWSEYAINTGPVRDENATNTGPTPSEVPPVVEFANNEDVTNTQPMQDQDTTNADPGRFAPDTPGPLEMVSDLSVFVAADELMSSEPSQDQDATNAGPMPSEAASVLEFESNEDETSAEPIQYECETGTTFLDLDDDLEPLAAIRPGRGMGIRHPSMLATQPMDDEARVEARAREMAVEAWDTADARTFEACEGQFDQFWMCRKRHFMDQAKQELTSETL